MPYDDLNVLKLVSYMYSMSNITACMFQSWDAAFTKDTLFERVRVVRDDFVKETINYKQLSLEDLKLLGFKPWDEKMDMLIPMWLFRLLPDDTKLYCPLDGEGARDLILRQDADDDYRFGCSAYALLETRKHVE